MIKIEKTMVTGWEPAIRGMRNPMNSWDKSDSVFNLVPSMPDTEPVNVLLGENDKKLMQQLISSGSDHAKFRRMIVVYCDVTAPLYWWKEYDTYKVGTVANSCSTMHKIAAKEFTLEDFSCEHLSYYDPEKDDDEQDDAYVVLGWEDEEIRSWYTDCFVDVIYFLNEARKKYIETKDKKYWWQMIQLLPSSYNQKRTLMLNYEVLSNIYHARKNHKLDEWHNFCDWIEKLPESWIITGAE